MFVSTAGYQKALKSVLSDGDAISVAIAFWGRGAEGILLAAPARKIEVICNLRSGATNPETIAAIRAARHVTVRQHDHLHAKVVLGENSALVGSANFSANGLNLEGDEAKGWEEAGTLTRDRLLLKTARTWFQSLWKASDAISDEDLDEARHQWEQRRFIRPAALSKRGQARFNVQVFDRAALRDRPISLVIYTAWASNEAEKAYRKWQKRMMAGGIVLGSKYPPIYENWPNLPEGQHLIDMYYGPRGGLSCYGVFTRVDGFRFKYKSGGTGHVVCCRKESSLLDKRFGPRERKSIASYFQPHIAEIWSSLRASGDADGKVISLHDALSVIEDRKA